MPYIGDYFSDTGVGTGSDRTKIEDDGTVKHEGAATVWEDITSSLIGKTLNSVAGKLDYNWDENTVTFQSGGSISTTADTLIFNVQVPHATKVDSTMKLHIHWEQDTATARTFTIQYRVQDNGAAKTTTWSQVIVDTDTYDVFTYTSGTLNQISHLCDIDLTDIGISATVQFRIARTDSETGDLEASFIDVHVEKDTEGSRTEYTK